MYFKHFSNSLHSFDSLFSVPLSVSKYVIISFSLLKVSIDVIGIVLSIITFVKVVSIDVIGIVISIIAFAIVVSIGEKETVLFIIIFGIVVSIDGIGIVVISSKGILFL